MLTMDRTLFVTKQQRTRLIVTIIVMTSIVITLLLTWLMFADSNPREGWSRLRDGVILSGFAHILILCWTPAMMGAINKVEVWIANGK